MEDIVKFCDKTINIIQEIITTESVLKTSTSNNRFQEITPLRPVLSMQGLQNYPKGHRMVVSSSRIKNK